MTDREGVYLAAARAYCVALYPYGPGGYAPGGRDSHIDADARSTAREPALRAAVDAVIEVLGGD
jgi:hypothetical protein